MDSIEKYVTTGGNTVASNMACAFSQIAAIYYPPSSLWKWLNYHLPRKAYLSPDYCKDSSDDFDGVYRDGFKKGNSKTEISAVTRIDNPHKIIG